MTSELAAHRADLYDAGSITVLAGLEAIRRRPAMYVGSTGSDGLYQLACELIENALDEALAGCADRIAVTLRRDGSIAVEDNGRGIPTELHPTERRPACEVVLTTLHAGGKFGGGAYARSGGLHGLGLSCVCALASDVRLDIHRSGRHLRQRFARGVALDALSDLGPTERTGTRIEFQPDREIFDRSAIDVERLRDRLRAIAFLFPVTTELHDELRHTSEHYREYTGIAGYLAHRTSGRRPVNAAPLQVIAAHGDVELALALQWTRGFAEDICSYVNGVHTSAGGTHVTGVLRGVCRAVTEHAAHHGLVRRDNEIGREDIAEGLACVISVRMAAPEFDGQAKFQLRNTHLAERVEELVARGLAEQFASDPETARAIFGRILESARTRRAVRSAAEQLHIHAFDPRSSQAVYQKQFGIRSADWHDSCSWLTDGGLLAAHAARTAVGPDARLLDVCCGSGVVGNAFGERVAHKTGLDLTAEMRALAATRLDEVHAGTVYELPFADATFDIVVTREILHILPLPERPLAEIFRVLRPGGQLVFGQTVPYGDVDAAWMFRIFKKKQPLFFNNLAVEDYLEMLARAGFQRTSHEDYFLWESIDRWIATHETTPLHRREIRELYYNAPRAVREAHPFEVLPSGEIRDRWRWAIFSAFKPEEDLR